MTPRIINGSAWVASFTRPVPVNKNSERTYNAHCTAVILAATIVDALKLLQASHDDIVAIHSINKHGGPEVIFDVEAFE